MFGYRNLDDEGNVYSGRSGCSLRMKNSRGRSAVEGGVQQVDIGQHHDEQHDAHHGSQQK